MKNLIFLTGMVLFCFGSNSYCQTIWIVDNNFNAPTGPNIFGSLQAAIDTASAGDIIHVQPSPISYGGGTIDRQLTIQGIGFNLDKDIPLQSPVGNILLTNNLDNTSDA